MASDPLRYQGGAGRHGTTQAFSDHGHQYPEVGDDGGGNGWALARA